MTRIHMPVPLLRVLAALLLALAAACQSNGGVVEDLDSRSGLTVVTDPGLAVFARTQGQFSRAARDYVYLGPVEINERGLREYLLWVGVASTIDRDFVAAESAPHRMLILDIGGGPVEFELEPWDQRMPRLAGRRVYDPVVAPSQSLAARVTLDQLARMAESDIQRVRIAGEAGPTIEYVLWEPSVWWPAFLRNAGAR